MPILIMNAGAAVITTKSPYIARVSFTMWQAAYPLGDYAYKNMGIKTVAVAYANYAPGKDSKTTFTTAFTKAGGKVVADIPFPFQTETERKDMSKKVFCLALGAMLLALSFPAAAQQPAKGCGGASFEFSVAGPQKRVRII